MPGAVLCPGGTTGSTTTLDPCPPRGDILGVTVREQDIVVVMRAVEKVEAQGADGICG